MKFLTTVTFIIITLTANATDHFGEKFEVKNAVEIEKILQTEARFRGKQVVVKGIVDKLCVKKGCWLNLGKSGQVVRVTFKNYGIFVPSSFMGKSVALQGIFNVKEESVERRKHLLEDEGRPRAEIDSITKPKKVFSIVASGIRII
mgnify:CR=1 FL=1